MGAFFLTCDKREYRCDFALELFQEMGFSSPRSLQIGRWTLYVYSKMSSKENNIISDGDHTIVSIGTPIYKGRNYSDSLKTIFDDYLSTNISFEQLVGQYTIIICHKDEIKILCDPLGSKHVFTDQKSCVLSSHMLPLCHCMSGQLHINRQALYEKLLIGFIMPPDTLFEEIVQIDGSVQKKINEMNTGVSFIHTPKMKYPEVFSKDQKNCLNEQAAELHSYFESIKEYSRSGVDLGLSGGYDSRLVLACLKQYTKERMHLHSHSTENVHQKDLKIANQMAEYVGVPCHITKTKKLNHYNNIDDVLRKSVLYFDGRSSFSIGGCGEVYTASYRINSTEGTPFTLTGVGGELYRNIFDLGHSKIRFDWFMMKKVFSPLFSKAISESLYHDISKTIIEKAASRLSIDKHQKQSKIIAHRYYCEIMMPDGQGVALDAYNQISCCVAPFLEPSIIASGYSSIPFHHSGGEFEGKLIDFIDTGLAAIPSSYGYPIGKRPMKAKIKERVRTFIPVSAWNKLSLIVHSENDRHLESMQELYANSETLKDAYSYMVKLFPEINFEVLIQSSENIRKIQFLAMTLYYLRERINVQ